MRNNNQTKSAIFGKLVPTVLLLVVFGMSFVSEAFATPATSTITPVSNHTALAATNGNKLVVAPDNTLHSVYAENGTIKYIRSSNGVTWTPPVVVSNVSNATSPVIAVAGSGTSWTIGIAFVDGTAISPFYTYKTASSPNWSLPVPVAGDNYQVGAASEPSMIGFGASMHLTWHRLGITLLYTTFAATGSNWPIVTFSEVVQDLCLCGQSSKVRLPSIAVSKTSATDSKPLVRIAYFYLLEGSSSKVAIAQRPATQSAFWPYAETEVQSHSAPWSSLLDYLFLDSLSLAANPETGDFYAACSYSWTEYASGKSHTVTDLLYENAWNTIYNWKVTPISTQRAQVDVTSLSGTASNKPEIRIAVSEFNSSTGYGQTWFRTGQWISGSAPTWKQAQVSVSTAGRDPQAIFWTRACSSSTVIYLNEKWREIYALFTATGTGGTTIQRSGDEGRCFGDQTNPM